MAYNFEQHVENLSKAAENGLGLINETLGLAPSDIYDGRVSRGSVRLVRGTLRNLCKVDLESCVGESLEDLRDAMGYFTDLGVTTSQGSPAKVAKLAEEDRVFDNVVGEYFVAYRGLFVPKEAAEQVPTTLVNRANHMIHGVLPPLAQRLLAGFDGLEDVMPDAVSDLTLARDAVLTVAPV